MRTSNPALNDKVFASERSYGVGEAMSIQGVVNKSFILFFLLTVSAWWMWNKILPAQSTWDMQETARYDVSDVAPWIVGSLIGGLVFSLLTIFVRKIAMYTAPLYALCEGVLLGGVSCVFEMQYPGIVVQAVGITFLTLFALLTLYKLRIVTVTQKFRLGVFAATAAVGLFYFATWILSFFPIGKGLMAFYYSSTPIGIAFNLIVAGIAALNLVLDFDLIEQLAEQGAPKYMEWYGAFALMVTLIWLYLEILRLLAKFRKK